MIDKRMLFLLLLFMVMHYSNAQTKPPAVLWSHTYGGSLNDEARDLQPGPDGNLVFNGYEKSIDGDVTGNHGLSDFWTVKLDPDGNIIWEKPFGGSDQDWGRSTYLASDGSYILTGYEQSTDGDVTNNHGDYDYWVIKVDANGNLVWQTALGGSNFDNAYCALETPDSGYLISGFITSSDGQVTGHHGYEDYWVVKLDYYGNLLWQKALGGSGYEQASNMVSTADGGVVICGYSNSVDDDVTGNHGSYDSWTVKIDQSGNIIWQKSYGGSLEDGSRDIIATPDGGFIITGYSYSNDGQVSGNHGDADYWIYKIDAVGNLIWQKSYGGSNWEYSYSIEKANDGNYLIAGYTYSSDGNISQNKGFADAWVLKINGNGNLIWQKTLGGSKNDIGRDFLQAPDGQYYFSGYTASGDGDIGTCHGGFDAWIMRLCDKFVFYADADHDGYGNPAVPLQACVAPEGYVSDHSDCKDNNSLIHPGVPDFCNGVDDNCNGQTDENAITPFITPDGYINICSGNSVTLTANSGSGLNYQWLKNNVAIPGATNQTFHATQAGIYKVTETNDFFCNATSDATFLTVFISPPAFITPLGDLDICETGSVVLQANAGTDFSYQWKKGSGNIPGATNQTYTATLPGTYKVLVTKLNECSKLSSARKVIKSCKEALLNYENPENSFSVYPNPTDGHFMIDIKTGDEVKAEATVEVMNLAGEKVFSQKTFITDGEIQREIFVNPAVAEGIYLVMVTINDKIYSAKVLYQK